jgi:hypothetical protein
MLQPFQITVGGSGLYDPIPGTSTINIPFLAGFRFYIEGTGIGTWKESNWSRKNDGGFNLLNGLTFAVNDVFTVHITSGFALSTTEGSYTNGYNLEKVMAALFARLGWKQPEKAGSPQIDLVNAQSISGRYFNDGSFHALVTVDNVKACMEEAGAADLNLNSYLTTLQQSIIMRSLNAVFDGPERVEETKLFERYGYNDQDIVGSGRFVGWEINVGNAKDTATQLDAIHLYTTLVTAVRLYLFKDGVKAPIWTDQFTVSAERSVTEFPVNDVILTTGRYWLGYFEDDLIDGNQGIWEQVECWNKTYVFGAEPVIMDADLNTLFIDKENRSYPGQTFGLNLELSSFRDNTRQIIRKANMFDELIGLSMASVIMEQIIYAVRSNATERILRDAMDKAGLQMELNGAAPVSESPKITSFKRRIEGEAKKVKELFYPKQKAITVNLAGSDADY